MMLATTREMSMDTVTATVRVSTRFAQGRKLVDGILKERQSRRGILLLRAPASMQQVSLASVLTAHTVGEMTAFDFTPAVIRNKPSGPTNEVMPGFTCAELHEAMQEARILDYDLALMCGVSTAAVQCWLGKGDDMRNPPGFLRILLALLCRPDNRQMADTIVSMFAVPRQREMESTT